MHKFRYLQKILTALQRTTSDPTPSVPLNLLNLSQSVAPNVPSSLPPNPANVFELYKMINLAKEKAQRNLAVQNPVQQEQMRYYQHCALLERVKQNHMMNSQVIRF